jgi:hypothetical protein
VLWLLFLIFFTPIAASSTSRPRRAWPSSLKAQQAAQAVRRLREATAGSTGGGTPPSRSPRQALLDAGTISQAEFDALRPGAGLTSPHSGAPRAALASRNPG